MTRFLRSRIMIAARPQYSYLAGKQSALRRLPDFCSSIFTHVLGCRRRLSRTEIPSLRPSMPEDYAKHSRYAKTSPLRTILELMGSRKERTSDQNNWHQWLPFAEFAHNQWPHETTKKTPFDLIMGFTPRTDWQGISQVPTVTQRLEEMEQARNRALAEMGRAQKIMAMRNQGNRRFKPYNKGDQVWVEGTNIKTLYPSAKLSPKRYGPF